MAKRQLAHALAMLICVWLASSAPAQWVDQGTPVCAGQWGTNNHQLVSNDDGGAIIVWEDYRAGSGTGTGDLYAAHVNRYGIMYWAENGVPVCTYTQAQLAPQVVSNGNGGALIFWTDFRGDIDIYAQHLDAYGNRLWNTDGHPVSVATNVQNACQAVADGFGGAVVVWQDRRSGNYDIYANRIDAYGNLLWGAGGLPICTHYSDQNNPYLTLVPGATPAEARVVVAWQDARNEGANDLDIYAQRLSLAGMALWTSGGVQVCGESHEQQMLGVVPSIDGAAIVAWMDQRNSPHVYAQRVAEDGTRIWDTDGVGSSWFTGTQFNPAIASDMMGGILITWEWHGSDYTAFTQRIDALGNRVWGGGGGVQLVFSSTEHDGGPKVAPDGSGGGLYGIWYSNSEYSGPNILPRRVTAAGDSEYWPSVCSDYSTISRDVEIINAGHGGALLAWRDNRDTGDPYVFDLYVQRIETEHGHWGNPDPVVFDADDVPDDNGGFVRLYVRASDWDDLDWEGDRIAWYNLWREVPDEVVAENPQPALRGMPDGYWESLGMHAAVQQDEYSYVVPTWFDSVDGSILPTTYLVTAHTIDPSLYFVSQPADAYSFDNLPPPAPEGLTVAYGSGTNVLDWDSGDPEDSASYNVYRGDEPDFIIGPSTLIASTTETTWNDTDEPSTGYHYQVTALDGSGNESDPASPDSISDAPDDTAPSRSGLLPNVPNPFNPSTTIVFQLSETSAVNLRVYDAAGTLVRTLVRGDVCPVGRHTRRWDGTDDGGRPVAAGVYFCRLDAGRCRETKAMTMVK
jgi:hypothetical protein